MIELQNDRLEIRFPDVHASARCSVRFHRTLRVPDDNPDYPLPAGLGHFPLLSVDAFNTPAAWKQHGGAFFPMYQSEAMWMSFDAGYPFAVKVAAGKINAVTGQPWTNELSTDPQDYVVLPRQPWLDGFSVSENVVRQFVASPLGDGLTAEEQITGEAVWGGLQLIFYPMKAERYRLYLDSLRREDTGIRFCLQESSADGMQMGLAPGGRIKQQIAKDSFGIDAWDITSSSRCFVHLLNSQAYQAITGRQPPTRPVTPKQYADANMPWFDYYLEGKVLPGAKTLAALDGIAAALLKKGRAMSHNKPITIAGTVDLSPSTAVREGQF